MWGDPAAIDRLAATCDTTGDDIADVSQRATRAAAAVPWHSTAGSSFQRRLDDFAGSAVRCAGEFHSAADDLRHHAATVRARIEEIHRLEREAARLAEEAARAVVDGGRAVVNAGRAVVNGAGHVASGVMHTVGSWL